MQASVPKWAAALLTTFASSVTSYSDIYTQIPVALDKFYFVSTARLRESCS